MMAKSWLKSFNLEVLSPLPELNALSEPICHSIPLSDNETISAILQNPNAGSLVEPIDNEPDYLSLILTANVYDVAIETPLTHARQLSTKLNNTLLLKREDLQPVFSFKLRGAYNAMSRLSDLEKTKGVIACSAGNHAQGVALAAQKLGIQATIVMPKGTPPIKWKNVDRMGAKVVLFGSDFDEAKVECARLASESGLTNIPPYDDPYVIAGQGTIGVELLRQIDGRKVSGIFICVGGGGLAAGISAYVKRLCPHIKIVGVEASDAASMTRSLLKGSRVTLPEVGLFADGAAVRTVGKETFRLCRSHIDEMVLVSTDEICAAIKDIFEDTRSIVEPAGALSVAGAKKYLLEKHISGETYICIASGANMNFDRLRFVAERADLGENREALISVIIPEKPGSFMKLYKTIYPRSVTEFSYRFGDLVQAHIVMSFTLNDQNERDAELKTVFDLLSSHNFQAIDASYDELMKAHARYLVGGRSHVPDERLFRFSFPERPGALHHFLESLHDPSWNVSLFHYRNYGGDVGKVMVGIQVPPSTFDDFELFLKNLKYPFVEETSNPLYRHFLQ